jgi:hypothetical protein
MGLKPAADIMKNYTSSGFRQLITVLFFFFSIKIGQWAFNNYFCALLLPFRNGMAL